MDRERDERNERREWCDRESPENGRGTGRAEVVARMDLLEEIDLEEW